MNFIDILKYPFWAMAVLGKEKSFVKNPVIGSSFLNKHGLHIKRIKLAASMAEFRRKQLARSSYLTREQLKKFENNGYFLVRNFLSDKEFRQLKNEVMQNRFHAREMRQGQAVTRMTPMGIDTLKRFPAIRKFYRNPQLKALFHYAASWKGSPINFIETVLADPENSKADPQAELHEDTFHSSAKFWFYLHDVEADGGPLQYVPGSHQLTPERLKWEYQNSLTASSSVKAHHSYGSFRVSPKDLGGLGYPQVEKMIVPENTLVIADTYGFHARSVSDKPTTRIALHGYLRRNPFLPWAGFDITSLPGISGRQLDLFLGYTDLRSKYLNKHGIWRDVGICNPADEPHI